MTSIQMLQVHTTGQASNVAGPLVQLLTCVVRLNRGCKQLDMAALAVTHMQLYGQWLHLYCCTRHSMYCWRRQFIPCCLFACRRLEEQVQSQESAKQHHQCEL